MTVPEIRQNRMQTLALAAAGGVALLLMGGALMLWHKYGTVMFMDMLAAAIWSCF